MKQIAWLPIVLLTLCYAISGTPTAAALTVGDAAPPLQVSKWVQGDPVTAFAPDQVYVVEFWATWCGPCLSSIPHLNELHQRFQERGVMVIGQNVWERKPEEVGPFVKRMGSKMSYRVALDALGEGPDAKGKMARTWMEAAGQNGIPTAFVVNKEGRIAWIGHPMKLQESVLEEILAGKFDLAKAAAEFTERQRRDAEAEPLWREFSDHKLKGEWEKAESTLVRLEEVLGPEDRVYAARLRFELLLERDDSDAALAAADRINQDPHADASLLNEIAWTLVTIEGLPARPLALAETIARHAHALAKEKDGEIADTLARVLFLQGHKEQAISLQEKAVQLVAGPRQPSFQKVLEAYREGRLPKGQEVAGWEQLLYRSLRHGRWDKADAALAELDKLQPAGEDDRYAIERFRVLAGRKEYRAAYRLAAQTADAHPDDVNLQNRWAWEIATASGLGERDLELAERIARRGHAAGQGKDAEIADTLARILFMKGRKEEAIQIQRQAVELASDRRKPLFQQTLEGYLAGNLPAR